MRQGQINMSTARDNHERMLELQKKIYPFSPTVRELQEAWCYSSTSATWHALKVLDSLGWLYTRKMEGKTYYYAKQVKP